MKIQISKKDGTKLNHRDGAAAEKYSIFGLYKMMNYAYVTIANEERNNRGLYTESNKTPEYYTQGINQLNNKINQDVWTLSSQKEQELTPPPTPQHIEDEAPIPNNSTVNVLESRKFVWPYGGKSVSLTGTFDNWQASIAMTPVNDDVYQVIVDNLDLSKDILFKFVVDGEWCYDVKQDYVTDETGNINNIIHADSTAAVAIATNN